MEHAVNSVRQLMSSLFEAGAHIQASLRLVQDEIRKHYGHSVAEEPLVIEMLTQALQYGPGKADNHPCWLRLGVGREPVVVQCYRGEHGEDTDEFQSRHPTLSFSSKEVATAYAETPNMQYDEVISARVFCCELQFLNPWVPDDDPYSSSVMPMSKFREVMSVADYESLLSSDDVREWLSCREDDFADFLAEHGLSPYEMDDETWPELVANLGVEAFDELNIETFHIVDLPVFVEALRRQGYDGVIVGSAGDYEGEFEYHPFYRHQVSTLSVERLTPAPLTVRVVRGVQSPEHAMSSAVASITFTDSVDVARYYATHLNDQQLENPREVNPSLVYADLTIKKPLVNTPKDPMIDLKDLRAAMADDEALRELLNAMSDWVVQTDAWANNEPVWQEQLSLHQTGKELLNTMLSTQLEQLIEPLCIQVYPLLDHAPFIQHIGERGYDGAVYRGSGQSLDATEYRVFSSSQLSNVLVREIQPHAKIALGR